MVLLIWLSWNVNAIFYGGAFATEVFHLWHRENARTTESQNRKRVEERMQTGLVEAPRGLRDHPQPDEVIV